jgi:flagellar biosynthetic protein FliO
LDHPKITHSGNYIILSFPNNFSATPALSSTNVLTKEIEKRVKADQSFPSTFSKESTDEQPSFLADGLLPTPEQDWGSTMLTLVLSLLFVLFLIYLIAFIYKRFFSSRFTSMQGNVSIRQVSSHHVGPKQKIIVFEMNERKFACGVTPTSINLIAELHDETDPEIIHSIQTNENAKDFNIDQTGESSEIDPEQPFEQTKTNVPNNKNSKDNFDTSIELEGLEKDIFLKSNVENRNSLEESNNRNNELKSIIKTHFSKTPTKTKIMPHGNPVMQNFASKLSERLKFLKPIK